MRSDRSSLRLAIGQVQMHWSVEDNLAEIRHAMRIAHREGARLCAFPELAIPGFHREIAALARPELIDPALRALQADCAQLSLALAVGLPTFDESGGISNSYVLLDQHGTQVSVTHKIGLTEPEASFFARGAQRPISELFGIQCCSVICREIEDIVQVCGQLSGTPDVILWPGQMRPDPQKPATDPPEHVVQAQRLARRLGVHIVQANWPNALNRPAESNDTGHSAVIDPTGSLLFRLPKAAPGVAVFDLGDARFEWFGGCA